MNRIVPKCKLKEICDTVQACIKLTSLNKDMISRTEELGDTKHPLYHIGLIDEHYFIINKTSMTSYCLTHYEDIKHLTNCNSIYMNTTGTYKTSNQKYIDSFKVVKLLLENKERLLEPIPYDDKIMNTQFYDKVTEYKTLEYPSSCVKYQQYEPNNTTIFH